MSNCQCVCLPALRLRERSAGHKSAYKNVVRRWKLSLFNQDKQVIVKGNRGTHIMNVQDEERITVRAKNRTTLMFKCIRLTEKK